MKRKGRWKKKYEPNRGRDREMKGAKRRREEIKKEMSQIRRKEIGEERIRKEEKGRISRKKEGKWECREGGAVR